MKKEITERIRFTVVGVVAIICFWIIWNTEPFEERSLRGVLEPYDL